jgi:hypothetical protein
LGSRKDIPYQGIGFFAEKTLQVVKHVGVCGGGNVSFLLKAAFCHLIKPLEQLRKY